MRQALTSPGGRWWCAKAKCWTAEPRLATAYPSETRALRALLALLQKGVLYAEGATLQPHPLPRPHA